MQSLAGISPGASIPSLQRLVAAGHARATKPGSRNRVAFSVTSKGERWLDAAWVSLLEAGPTGDFDSDLRIFLLALYRGRDSARARKFLRATAERRAQALAKLQQKSREETTESWLAEQYRSLRATSAIGLLKAETKEILSLVNNSPRSPAPRKRAIKRCGE